MAVWILLCLEVTYNEFGGWHHSFSTKFSRSIFAYFFLSFTYSKFSNFPYFSEIFLLNFFQIRASVQQLRTYFFRAGIKDYIHKYCTFHVSSRPSGTYLSVYFNLHSVKIKVELLVMGHATKKNSHVTRPLSSLPVWGL